MIFFICLILSSGQKYRYQRLLPRIKIDQKSGLLSEQSICTASFKASMMGYSQMKISTISLSFCHLVLEKNLLSANSSKLGSIQEKLPGRRSQVDLLEDSLILIGKTLRKGSI